MARRAALARQRRLNRLHSALLLLSLAGLAGVTGSVVGGPEGLLLGAGAALLELLADAGAVELTGDAAALAGALARIWRLQGDDWERLATRGAGWIRWFRIHPTVRERIAALRAMAAPARQEPARQDRIAVVPVEVWSLGGHHPAQRLARRWLL